MGLRVIEWKYDEILTNASVAVGVRLYEIGFIRPIQRQGVKQCFSILTLDRQS